MSRFAFLIISLLVMIITVLSKSQITLGLVLGLRHSRANLLTPKTLSQSATALATALPKKQSAPLISMVEPLKAVRDGFLVPLSIGTPSQVVQVYMDTGSDLTWVPCGNTLSFDCLDCDDFKTDKSTTATFSPSRSTTALRDLCGSPYCTDIHSSDNYIDTCAAAGCSLSTLIKSSCPRPCPSFAYTYGAGGVVTGVLTRDTLRVHQNYISSPSLSKEIANFSFGCVGSTYREPIGIAGFGRGALSLPSQLGLLEKGFSHCFLPFKFANDPNVSSPLVVGDVSDGEESLRFTPMLRSHFYPSYYYIGLEAITVGDQESSSGAEIILPASSSLREFDSEGNGGMLIDSGTTYTHLPEPTYSKLLFSLRSAISFPRDEGVEARTGFDLCYKIPYSGGSEGGPEVLPAITFHFLNNASVVLSGGSHVFYSMGKPRDSAVVKCLLIQSMGDGGDNYGPAGVFGSFQQQDLKVVYDLENQRIGFRQMDCASSAVFHGLYQKP